MALFGYTYRITLQNGRVYSGEGKWFGTREEAVSELERQIAAFDDADTLVVERQIVPE